MTWYELLLFVHITAAVIWLGGAFTFQMYGAVVRRGGDPEELARFAGRAGHLGERMFVPASLLVVLAGVGLMIDGNWDWDQLWVVFALVTFAASFVTGLLRHLADGEADSCRRPDHAGGPIVDPAPLHRPADRSRLHVRHRLRNGGQADRRRRLDDRDRRSRARCADRCVPRSLALDQRSVTVRGDRLTEPRSPGRGRRV